MTKMTQRDYFNEVIALAKANDRLDLVEFAEGRIAVLDKKASNKKPTKTQEANADIKNDIMSVMADGTSRTITDIISAVPSLNGATNQKASALVKQLVEANLLKREEVKRKAYFTIIV